MWPGDSPQVVLSKHCIIHPRLPAWAGINFCLQERRREAILQQGPGKGQHLYACGTKQKKQESHSYSVDWCLFREMTLFSSLVCMDCIFFTKWWYNKKSDSRRIEGSRLVYQRLTLIWAPSHSCASCTATWFCLSQQAWCRWTLVSAPGEQV